MCLVKDIGIIKEDFRYWAQMGRWCRSKGKKVKTSQGRWTKANWFKKHGTCVENGKRNRYTFESITRGSKMDEKWDFTWFNVIHNDNHYVPEYRRR